MKSTLESLAANTFYFDENGCQAKLKDFKIQSSQCQASTSAGGGGFNKRYIDHSDILKRLKYILDEKAEKKEEFDDLVENFDNIETISVSKSKSSSQSSRSGSQERALQGKEQQLKNKPSEADIDRIKTYSVLLNHQDDEDEEAKPSQVVADNNSAATGTQDESPVDEVPKLEVDSSVQKEATISAEATQEEENLKVQDEIAVTNEIAVGPLDAEIDQAILDCISENLVGDSDEVPVELQARVSELEAAGKPETAEEDGAELISKKSSSSTSDQASYVMISSSHDDGDAASDDSRRDADCSLKAENDEEEEEDEEEEGSKIEEASDQTVNETSS